MKKSAIVFLVLLWTGVAAGFEEPDNFRGIKWGTAPREITTVFPVTMLEV